MKKIMSSVIILSLTGLLLVSTLLPSVASAATPNSQTETKGTTHSVNVQTNTLNNLAEEQSEEPVFHTTGIKGYLVKLAANTVSLGIRHGGAAVGQILKHADAKAAKAFKKNSGYIADKIDEIAELPDVTAHMISDKLFKALKGKIGGGSAKIIADGVYYAINLLLF